MKMQVFDGHNDALLRLWKGGMTGVAERFARSDTGHIDVVRAKQGGFVGGFFAMFPPPAGAFAMPDFTPPYDVALPPMMPQEQALKIVVEQAGVMQTLHRAGVLALCTSRAEIEAATANGKVAAILHLEGAEAIDADLAALETLYAAGLRSLGPVWSRPTIFGHGVPFRYPSDADTGPGLTPEGKALVNRCRELRMVVDTSHLNMAGFWDVGSAGVPLVATHSNVHSISPGARNLTDDQLRAIGETNGMVGLNFGTMFLAEDGRASPDVPLDIAVRHLSRMVELAGEDHVGLGSDFDGAPMPSELQSCADLPNLVAAMKAAQFGETLIEKICHRNWLDLLERTLD